MRIPAYLGWPLLAAGGYGALSFLAYHLLFQPMKYPGGWWEVRDEIGAQDVWLETPDGVRLHGWWSAAATSSLATLFLHGNAGNVSHCGRHIREINAAGSSVLMLDYRGYGKSGGRPGEKGLYTDAETAYRHLTRSGYSPDRILLYGESLGAAVAIELATRVPVGGMILEAPFTSARDVSARVAPILGPLVVRGFNSRDKICRVHTPLLVIHGECDEVIGFDLGRKLFAAAREPKQFWAVPGASHEDIIETAGEQYRRRLDAFYVSVTPQG